MFLSIVRIIDLLEPDLLVVEAVQRQSNDKTMMMLSQLQGMLIGYAYIKNISVSSPLPVEWRKVLGFHQGPKVKREELKKQAVEFAKSQFNLDLTEDEAESACIAFAAYSINKGE